MQLADEDYRRRVACTGASKQGVAPVHLGNFRAGVTGPAREGNTEENTEDR